MNGTTTRSASRIRACRGYQGTRAVVGPAGRQDRRDTPGAESREHVGDRIDIARFVVVVQMGVEDRQRLGGLRRPVGQQGCGHRERDCHDPRNAKECTM